MARILNNPDGNNDRVQVIYSPEELLPKSCGDGKLYRDVIQAMAWSDLHANAPQIIRGHKKLAYGNTTVLDGKYVVTFYEALPAVTPAPEVVE